MKKVLTILGALSFTLIGIAQNVGIGTTTPDASAQLDLSSTTRGLLPPRMTTAQRDAIINPAAGLVIFNTNTNGIEIKSSVGWISLNLSSADTLPTIQIGTQKWMSMNLDVSFYRNGDPIPMVTDPAIWVGLTTGAWCYYDNAPFPDGDRFGKLYNWYAVNDPRGLAPQGWHIPSDAEWTLLSTTLGGDLVAGGKMKLAGSGNYWLAPNMDGTNYSGFGARGGGNRYNASAFDSHYYTGYWWSATEFNAPYAWCRNLVYSNGILYKSYYSKQFGMSVRCVRD
jgi:uncharacterized protein (TIGR02145 family)